jgi:hypothetical protein
VRSACARVAERARAVRIDQAQLERYAEKLPIEEVRRAGTDAFRGVASSVDVRAAFVLSLNAINFGSGYFPQLKKRAGKSGYRTLESCLREQFGAAGPFTAAELRVMTGERCAQLLGQSAPSPQIRELMELYAQSWRELGSLLERRFGGSFTAFVEAAGGSAARLVQALLELPLYHDIAGYAGFSVPLLKRAQLCVSDLALALPDDLGRFQDLDRLTAFADNLVAHVLRVDGILRYEPDLARHIEREELIAAGSPEEVEIRACEVHAVELLTAELERRSLRLVPRQLDAWLWNRGGRPAYKAQPRHRTRCPYY